MPPKINPKLCIRCGMCADICPMDVFTRKKKEVPEVKYGEDCWHCNACVLDCPKEAISLRIPLNYQVLYIDAKQLNGGRND